MRNMRNMAVYPGEKMMMRSAECANGKTRRAVRLATAAPHALGAFDGSFVAEDDHRVQLWILMSLGESGAAVS